MSCGTHTCRTFAYKEVVICTCPAGRLTGISLEFDFSLIIFGCFIRHLGVNFSFDKCGMFVAGEASASIDIAPINKDAHSISKYYKAHTLGVQI